MKRNSCRRHRRRSAGAKSEGTFFRKEGQGSSFFSPAHVGKTASYVNSLNGSGQSLPTGINQFFSARMGHDFSNVKVHTGKDAADSAKDINARAYTKGNNIVFNEGQYNMGSGEGKKLMAHELTHVVQNGREQDGTNISRKATFSGSDKDDVNIAVKYAEAAKKGAGSSHVGKTDAFLNGQDVTAYKSFPLNVATDKDITTVQNNGKYESTVTSYPDNKMTYKKHVPLQPSGNIWSHSTTADDFKKILGKKCSGKQLNVYVRGKPDSGAIITSVDKHETRHVKQFEAAFNNHIAPLETDSKNLKFIMKTEKDSRSNLLSAINTNAKDALINFNTEYKAAADTFHGEAEGANASFSKIDIDGDCTRIKTNVTT
jgi:hypothetical protein